jgi:hypothetical protein
LWKSYIFNKVNQTAEGQSGVFQVAITAQIFLKHLHSFFERVPLLKGVFMKMTLNLNQSSVNFDSAAAGGNLTLTSVNSPLGGVSPIMISSAVANSGSVATFPQSSYIASIAVGSRCLNTTQASLAGVLQSPLGSSIILNVPAYTFNPVFETSYLSSPVKKIVYTDIYQYQVVNQIAAGQTLIILLPTVLPISSLFWSCLIIRHPAMEILTLYCRHSIQQVEDQQVHYVYSPSLTFKFQDKTPSIIPSVIHTSSSSINYTDRILSMVA